jgi:hypothetical protein
MWGTLQQEAIEFGNVIHEILSFVKTKSDVDLAILKAMENGLITFNQKEAVYKSIQEIVNHSELENYFAEGNEILNEQTIIQKEGKPSSPTEWFWQKTRKYFYWIIKQETTIQNTNCN